MTESNPDDFDATDLERGEVATAAAADRELFVQMMQDYYRGEMSQSGNLLSRLDLTSDWAIVLVTAVLALAFQGGDVTAYLLLIGILGVSLFLYFDIRRYRTYDASRARLRLIEENLFANALEPSGSTFGSWRAELGEDLRKPTLKVSFWEALSRRLRRIYFPLQVLLGIAWLFRITLYEPGESWAQTASIPGVSGPIVVGLVGAFFLAMTAITFWPREREAKGEFHGEKLGRWKR